MSSTAHALAIGLTGGIGSGKSSASAILKELGATLIDADRVGHEIYVPERPAWQEIVDAFGRDVIAANGAIDRKKLGERVFAEPAALKTLNAIVQPRIAADIASQIRALREEGLKTPIVVEAAVLLEAGWQWLVDEIWVVTVAPERAIARVMSSRGLSRSEVERRVASQLSDVQRTREASCVIPNDGTLADLRAAIETCWRTRIAPTT